MEAPPSDQQYRESAYRIPQRPHRYGDGVYLVDDPYLLTLSAQLSHASTLQPRFNEIVSQMYGALFQMVANAFLRRRGVDVPTRMIESTPRARFVGEIIDPDQRLVLVDLARAGMVPAMDGLSFFSRILAPGQVRVDHIFINRMVHETEKRVVGADVAGVKIGGEIDGALLVIPDPMAATGSSMLRTLGIYDKEVAGKPRRRVTLHLIAAPEYIRVVKAQYPDVEIVTVRLDRGLSEEKILGTVPGSHWEKERGLNEHQYIVPGAGGVGELMNNSSA